MGSQNKYQVKSKPNFKKTKKEKEFDLLMKQFEQVVEKKNNLLGTKTKEPKPKPKKSKIHFEDMYKSNQGGGKTATDSSPAKLSEYSKLTGTRPGKQKSILKKKRVKVESPPNMRRRKTGLAFLMDGLKGYDELGYEEKEVKLLKPVKRVKFLDTKSEVDLKKEKDEFTPMFNYENTALVHEKPKPKEKSTVKFVKPSKPKKAEKTKKPNVKAKNARAKRKPKKKETKKADTRPKALKKSKKTVPKMRATAKNRAAAKPKPRPAKKPRVSSIDRGGQARAPVQNKTSIKSESSTSEIEFKYDSDSETTSVESEMTPKTVGTFYNMSSDISNRKKIINAFKKKNNLGRKSFFKTMDFDSRKQKVSRKDVVKNKHRAHNLQKQPNAESNGKHSNRGIGDLNTLGGLIDQPLKANSKNSTLLRSKTVDFEKPPESPFKMLQRSLVNVDGSEPGGKGKVAKKASAQPWKTSIRDRVKKLKKSLEAKAFIIHESSSNLVLISHNAKEVREMASLTKMMTLYTTLKFCSKHQISMREEYFEVTPKAAGMNGTSAKLHGNTFVSIEDLLRGLMLPSGNDAAMCIAENIGRLLRLESGDLSHVEIYSGYNSLQPDFLRFVALMNEYARFLGLSSSQFGNPHGLNDVNNVSTCEDLLKLSLESMKMSKFREVVKTVEYTGQFMKKKTRKLPRSVTLNEGIRSMDERQLDMRRHTPRSKQAERGLSGGTA